jgi:hypothetical protein
MVHHLPINSCNGTASNGRSVMFSLLSSHRTGSYIHIYTHASGTASIVPPRYFHIFPLDWIVGAQTNTNPAMESSRGKLSAAAVLLLMTLLMVAAMRAVEARDCLTQSTRLPGHLCVRSDYCAIGCRAEGKGYTGGRCLISPIPLDGILCYCVKPCTSTTTE